MKTKKPFYKKWWGIVLILIIVWTIIALLIPAETRQRWADESRQKDSLEAAEINLHDSTALAQKEFDAKTEREVQANKPKVINSEWDASVYQVENYLKQTLNDADSYESVQWGKVIKLGVDTHTGYSVWHSYRAKNGFGGTILVKQNFFLDVQGNVIGVTDLKL